MIWERCPEPGVQPVLEPTATHHPDDEGAAKEGNESVHGTHGKSNTSQRTRKAKTACAQKNRSTHQSTRCAAGILSAKKVEALPVAKSGAVLELAHSPPGHILHKCVYICYTNMKS